MSTMNPVFNSLFSLDHLDDLDDLDETRKASAPTSSRNEFGNGKSIGVSGATNVTLRAPRPKSTVETWSLPAYASCIRSPSIMMSTGDDLVVIRSRIARALNIQDDDTVEFRFDATGDTFDLKVKVRDSICSDVLLHDLIGLGMAESVSMDRYGETVKFKSGRAILLPRQHMWAGMRVVTIHGSACLFFDGASRNNPRGPAGYGFHIVEGSDGNGDELVEGYGYAGMDRSNNEMEYEGLMEAIIWATRLDLANLTICGDSELIINQLTGKYNIKNHRLKVLHSKAHALLQQYSNLNVTFKHIPREKNAISDNLANRAIATKKTVITVNWPNVNKFMQNDEYA